MRRTGPLIWNLLGSSPRLSPRSGLSARIFEPNSTPVTDALRAGKYPWYDADADRLQPVWPPRMSWLTWLGKRLRPIADAISAFFDRFKFGGTGGIPISGNVVATIVLLAALIAFFFCLLMLWLHRERGAVANEDRRARLSTAARLGDLPEELRPGDGDPWAEAQRRRAAGDFSGAIVCLFAHQLIALDEIGLIRLAPGKTGRHYLRGLHDRILVDALGATLRLFEDVYYGRRSPTREAFESVWKLALAFQARRRMLSAGASP